MYLTFNANQVDSRLSKLVDKIESQGYKVLAGRYVRYNVQQMLVKVTISELREVDIFEEFILSTAINVVPSVTIEELANVLGIDSMLMRSVAENLQSWKFLELTSDSTLKITPFGKKIFQEENSVLEPSYTQNIYAIADPLTNQINFDNTRLQDAPLELKSLGQFIAIDKYPDISALTIADVQNIALDIVIREKTQKVTSYQELSTITTVRKKISIFYLLDSQDQYIIKIFSEDQELKIASDSLTEILSAGNEQQIVWDELFRLSDAEIALADSTEDIADKISFDWVLDDVCFESFYLDEETELANSSETKILPAFSRYNTPDAEDIKSFVLHRRIEKLLHLTRLENLNNICRADAILSLYQLEKDNICTNPFDGRKLEGQKYKNYVNCSLTYYNFFMLYGLVHKSEEPVVLLYIKPDYLWKQGIEFCKFNAATGGGRHIAPGYHTLQTLFDDTVQDRQGLQDRNSKPINLPTCIQAEVLIRDGIPLADIMEIVIRSPRHEQNVRQAGWRGNIRVSSRDFDWHSEWIVRGS
ncbi:DarT ssDNA thymidine ADP-ribosyltransferase family protein [Nostoc sp.]